MGTAVVYIFISFGCFLRTKHTLLPGLHRLPGLQLLVPCKVFLAPPFTILRVPSFKLQEAWELVRHMPVKPSQPYLHVPSHSDIQYPECESLSGYSVRGLFQFVLYRPPIGQWNERLLEM